MDPLSRPRPPWTVTQGTVKCRASHGGFARCIATVARDPLAADTVFCLRRHYMCTPGATVGSHAHQSTTALFVDSTVSSNRYNGRDGAARGPCGCAPRPQ